MGRLKCAEFANLNSCSSRLALISNRRTDLPQDILVEPREHRAAPAQPRVQRHGEREAPGFAAAGEEASGASLHALEREAPGD